MDFRICVFKKSKCKHCREKTDVTAHWGRVGCVWERRAGCHLQSKSSVPHQQHVTTTPPTWTPNPGFWLTCHYREHFSMKGSTGCLVSGVLLQSIERNVILSKPFCPSLPLAGWKYQRLGSWNNAGMGEGRGERKERQLHKERFEQRGGCSPRPSPPRSLGRLLKGRKRKRLAARHCLYFSQELMTMMRSLFFSRGNDVLP